GRVGEPGDDQGSHVVGVRPIPARDRLHEARSDRLVQAEDVTGRARGANAARPSVARQLTAIATGGDQWECVPSAVLRRRARKKYAPGPPSGVNVVLVPVCPLRNLPYALSAGLRICTSET